MALTVTPRGIAATVVVLAVAAVCVRLGVWQLDRLEQRRTQNAAFAAAAEQPPVVLDAAAAQVAAAAPGELLWRRVEVAGSYLAEPEIVVRARARDSWPGVHLVTPLRIDGSPYVVLVNRGWAASRDGASVDVAALREPSDARVVGVVQPLSPDDAPTRAFSEGGVRSVQRLTYADLQPAVSAPILPFVVLQLPGPADAGPPFRLEPPRASEGNHLAYAIQWFSFAAIALIGWAVMVGRAQRR